MALTKEDVLDNFKGIGAYLGNTGLEILEDWKNREVDNEVDIALEHERKRVRNLATEILFDAKVNESIIITLLQKCCKLSEI